jgi:asparagine synthase (glutamine-hydrolysing)
MGFPVPLSEWMRDELRDFVMDVFTTRAAREREVIDNRLVAQNLESEPAFGRKIWGLLSLEIWQQEFHDKAAYFRGLAQPRGCARAA